MIDSLQYPSIDLGAIPTSTPLFIPKCYEEDAIAKTPLQMETLGFRQFQGQEVGHWPDIEYRLNM